MVGYHAMTITQKLSSNDFSLTDTDKKNLLKIARQSIEQYFKTKTRLPKPDALLTPNLLKPCGAFVTLHKHGELRGCIGHFGEDKPLWETVAEMALASAFNDTRFYPLSEEELREIEIEISVLTPMRKISSINEIQLGKHGIYIKKGWRSGTFLPQVATETGWTLEEFLGHCSRDKAGLGWDGWKDAEIYVYEAIVFSEKEF
ncbi:MAG TPA: AmmeMemoRadiSam system protein A [Bacteroidales bacterium]|nr:AmmeMemoRadiSam system protein A [Bacteroidales bacterium]